MKKITFANVVIGTPLFEVCSNGPQSDIKSHKITAIKIEKEDSQRERFVVCTNYSDDRIIAFYYVPTVSSDLSTKDCYNNYYLDINDAKRALVLILKETLIATKAAKKQEEEFLEKKITDCQKEE